MGAELAHEVAQKGRHRVVGDLTISGEDLRCVSDVGLRRVVVVVVGAVQRQVADGS